MSKMLRHLLVLSSLVLNAATADDEIPGPPDGTLEGDIVPPGESLGFACVYAGTSNPLGVAAYMGKEKLDPGAVVPHGSVVQFHCPVPRYYRLVGNSAVQCVDGAFNDSVPTCQPGIAARMLVVDVEAEYVLGPGGLYVVPPGIPVRMSCYQTLTMAGTAPHWQWDANRDVFITEESFLGSRSSALRLDTVEGTKGTFICSNGIEEVVVRLEARGDRCTDVPRCRGLRMRANSLKADFACQPPGILQGALSTRCQHFRDWDRESPVCLYKDCAPQDSSKEPTFPCTLPDFSGGLEAYAGTRRARPADVIGPGQSVQFHCMPVGVFVLVGQSTLKCVDGKWDHEVPICALNVPTAVVVRMEFPYSVGPGGVVHVIPFTDVSLRCVSTNRKLPPHWVLQGVDVDIVDQKTVERLTASDRLIFRTSENTTGIFSCNSHPESPVKESKVVRLVTKEPVCPIIEETEGLRIRANFDMAVFDCEPPGVLVGSAVLRCQPFGEWDHPVPYCFYQHCEPRNTSVPSSPPAKPAPTLPPPITPLDGRRAPTTTSTVATKPPTTSAPVRSTPPGVRRTPTTTSTAATKPPTTSASVQSTPRPPSSMSPTRLDLPKGVKCPEKSGIFPHPTECKKFLHCSFGKPNIVECPGDTVFNPMYKVCDSKTAVKCLK